MMLSVDLGQPSLVAKDDKVNSLVTFKLTASLLDMIRDRASQLINR